MKTSIYILVLTLCSFYASVASNRAFPPEKVLNLALGASKDAYLPPLFNIDIGGSMLGNWDTMPKLSTVVIGTLADLTPPPNLFSWLPKQIYNPIFNFPVCAIWWNPWWAEWHIGKLSKVLKLSNKGQKVVVFAFRGDEAYSLKALEKNFIANITTSSVHSEYYDLYKDTAAWFLAEYKKISSDYTVIVTGYDTGGAQAYIAAMEATSKLDRRPDAVITFGSPTVGDLEFRSQYRSQVGCNRTLSIVVVQDIFTRYPIGAIRPCEDTPVDGGQRPVNELAEFLKNSFLTAFPDIVPKIIDNLLPKGIKEPINKVFPPEKQGDMIRNSMSSVDKFYTTILDFEYFHNLYQAYEHGIKELYKGKEIDVGCHKKF